MNQDLIKNNEELDISKIGIKHFQMIKVIFLIKIYNTF